MLTISLQGEMPTPSGKFQHVKTVVGLQMFVNSIGLAAHENPRWKFSLDHKLLVVHTVATETKADSKEEREYIENKFVLGHRMTNNYIYRRYTS